MNSPLKNSAWSERAAGSRTGLEIRLARRPDGFPSPDDFDLVEVAVPEPAPGQVLARNLYMSPDPGMLLLMAGTPSLPASRYETGAVMYGDAIGEVVASADPSLAAGGLVVHRLGRREFAVDAASAFRRVDRSAHPSPSLHLGFGPVAYVGLMEAAELRPGDTVFVSSAAGATGSMAGQIARLKGAARVIGSGGSGRSRGCAMCSSAGCRGWRRHERCGTRRPGRSAVPARARPDVPHPGPPRSAGQGRACPPPSRPRPTASPALTRAQWLAVTRLTASIGLSSLVADLVHPAHAYWMPLTAVMVCRLDRAEQTSRLKHRAAGTALGALMVLTVTAAAPHDWGMVLRALAVGTVLPGVTDVAYTFHTGLVTVIVLALALAHPTATAAPTALRARVEVSPPGSSGPTPPSCVGSARCSTGGPVGGPRTGAASEKRPPGDRVNGRLTVRGGGATRSVPLGPTNPVQDRTGCTRGTPWSM